MDTCDHVFTKSEMESFKGSECLKHMFLYELKVDIFHSPCPPPYIPKLENKDVPQLRDMRKNSDISFQWAHGDVWSHFVGFFEDLYKCIMNDLCNYLQKKYKRRGGLYYERNQAYCALKPTVLQHFSNLGGEKKKWIKKITDKYISHMLSYLEREHVFENPRSTFYWENLSAPYVCILDFVKQHMSPYTEMNFCYLGGPRFRPHCISVREMHKRIQLVLQGNKMKCSLFGKLSIELVYKILDSMNLQSFSGTKWSSFSSGKYAITI